MTNECSIRTPDHGWVIVSSGSRLDDRNSSFDREAVVRMLDEAGRIAPAEQILFVGLESESPWWTPLVARLPARNIISQPIDRGSAPGIVVAFLRIFRRDPGAEVVIFAPSSQRRAMRRVLPKTSSAELLSLIRDAQPTLYAEMIAHVREAHEDDPSALDALYPFLPAIDFERDVLGGAESRVHANAAA